MPDNFADVVEQLRAENKRLADVVEQLRAENNRLRTEIRELLEPPRSVRALAQRRMRQRQLAGAQARQQTATAAEISSSDDEDTHGALQCNMATTERGESVADTGKMLHLSFS